MAFARRDSGERLEQGEGGVNVAIRLAQALERPEGETLRRIMDEESIQPGGGRALEPWQIDEVLELMQTIWHTLTPLLEEDWRLARPGMDLTQLTPELIHQTPAGPSLGNALAWFHGAVMFLQEARAADQTVDFG